MISSTRASFTASNAPSTTLPQSQGTFCLRAASLSEAGTCYLQAVCGGFRAHAAEIVGCLAFIGSTRFLVNLFIGVYDVMEFSTRVENELRQCKMYGFDVDQQRMYCLNSIEKNKLQIHVKGMEKTIHDYRAFDRSTLKIYAFIAGITLPLIGTPFPLIGAGLHLPILAASLLGQLLASKVLISLMYSRINMVNSICNAGYQHPLESSEV